MLSHWIRAVFSERYAGHDSKRTESSLYKNAIDVLGGLLHPPAEKKALYCRRSAVQSELPARAC